MNKRLVSILAGIILFSHLCYAEESTIKLRGSSNTKTSTADFSIKIHPEMLVIKEFKKIKDDYKALKAYAKDLDKVNKIRNKKISKQNLSAALQYNGLMEKKFQKLEK